MKGKQFELIYGVWLKKHLGFQIEIRFEKPIKMQYKNMKNTSKFQLTLSFNLK